MFTQDSEIQVTSVAPEYGSGLLDGHFNITFNETADTLFRLSFSAFLRQRFTIDKNLKRYVRNLDKDDTYTASAIIANMYDLGLPLDEWVSEYMEEVKERMDAFGSLIRIFHILKSFGDDERA